MSEYYATSDAADGNFVIVPRSRQGRSMGERASSFVTSIGFQLLDKALGVCLGHRDRTVTLPEASNETRPVLEIVDSAVRTVDPFYMTKEWSEVEIRMLRAQAAGPFPEDKRFSRAPSMMALLALESQAYTNAKIALDVANRHDVDAVRFCNTTGEWSEPLAVEGGLQETVPVSSRLHMQREGRLQKIMGVAFDPEAFDVTHAVVGIMADDRFNALRTFVPEVATREEVERCFIGVPILQPPTETGTIG